MCKIELTSSEMKINKYNMKIKYLIRILRKESTSPGLFNSLVDSTNKIGLIQYNPRTMIQT